ncbi:hypothetical protein CRE_21372 [Caenorhabditis remanei]|uniref:MRG domain-containing protein n=1 Tax=Caenorhabditis remanei TaxID=31234 RepID=E3MUL8_CAERE|nr:hypothetical protein CRE_21372 [Caenorhabditis remanei]
MSEFAVGEKCVCIFGGKPYPAKISKIKEHRGVRYYIVHYEGWAKTRDERLPMGTDRLHKGTIEEYNRTHPREETPPVEVSRPTFSEPTARRKSTGAPRGRKSTTTSDGPSTSTQSPAAAAPSTSTQKPRGRKSAQKAEESPEDSPPSSSDSSSSNPFRKGRKSVPEPDGSSDDSSGDMPAAPSAPSTSSRTGTSRGRKSGQTSLGPSTATQAPRGRRSVPQPPEENPEVDSPPASSDSSSPTPFRKPQGRKSAPKPEVSSDESSGDMPAAPSAPSTSSRTQTHRGRKSSSGPSTSTQAPRGRRSVAQPPEDPEEDTSAAPTQTPRGRKSVPEPQVSSDDSSGDMPAAPSAPSTSSRTGTPRGRKSGQATPGPSTSTQAPRGRRSVPQPPEEDPEEDTPAVPTQTPRGKKRAQKPEASLDESSGEIPAAPLTSPRTGTPRKRKIVQKQSHAGPSTSTQAPQLPEESPEDSPSPSPGPSTSTQRQAPQGRRASPGPSTSSQAQRPKIVVDFPIWMKGIIGHDTREFLHNQTTNKLVVRLQPEGRTVDDIIKDYTDSIGVSDEDVERMDDDMLDYNDDGTSLDNLSLAHCAKTLKNYFNRLFGRRILYNSEREEHDTLVRVYAYRKKLRYGDVVTDPFQYGFHASKRYGIVHFARMLSRFDNLIESLRLHDAMILYLNLGIKDLMEFLGNNVGRYYDRDADYVPPSYNPIMNMATTRSARKNRPSRPRPRTSSA